MSEEARGRPCIVVKLGGSLAADPSLPRWLEAMLGTDAARFVVVPGGGPFADTVRSMQAARGFSDELAHAMALLAMDQFGLLLCGLNPCVLPCLGTDHFEAAWSAARLPVWLPSRLMAEDRSLDRNWSVTSDTIAAWLAHRIGAGALLLVKSCELPAVRDDAGVLAAAGIVDAALPDFIRRHGMHLEALQRNQWNDLAGAVPRLAWRD